MCNNLNHEIGNTSEHLRGMRDAREGKPAEVAASDDYMNGYNEVSDDNRFIEALNIQPARIVSLFQ